MRTINNVGDLRRLISREARSLINESRRDKYSLRALLEAGDPEDEISKLDVSKGPSSAVAWLNGPGADPRVRALLNSGRRDGEETDESAAVSEGSATIGDLVPTQIEIELTKSIAFPLAKFGALKKMISGGVQRVGPPDNDTIVTSGNLIVDGHHRWSSLFSVAGPGGQIATKNIDLGEQDASSVLAIVQTAIAATLTKGQPVPKAKAGGMNILGKSKDEIAKMITSAYESGSGEVGPILTDEFVEKCLADPTVSKHFGLNTTAPGGAANSASSDADQKAEVFGRSGALLEKSSKRGKSMDRRIVDARKKIINKVSDNLSQMNQPAAGSPPRVDMPQLDKAAGGAAGALEKIETGKVNYKTPFAVVDKKKQASGAEGPGLSDSRVRQGDIVLERWHRLAGLIK